MITWIDARFPIKGGDSARGHKYPTRRMLYKLISSAILLLALAQGVASSPSLGARLVECGPGPVIIIARGSSSS
ncbi:hypothetical protein DFH09DRAFT_1334873 [Mycena vulgaris]|nr:hypothetical protein DFH09DRAFT_1334873 [Mycena vulgaris]